MSCKITRIQKELENNRMSKLKKPGTENEAILKIKRNLLSIHIEEIKSNNSISINKEEDEMIHMKTK